MGLTSALKTPHICTLNTCVQTLPNTAGLSQAGVNGENRAAPFQPLGKQSASFFQLQASPSLDTVFSVCSLILSSNSTDRAQIGCVWSGPQESEPASAVVVLCDPRPAPASAPPLPLSSLLPESWCCSWRSLRKTRWTTLMVSSALCPSILVNCSRSFRICCCRKPFGSLTGGLMMFIRACGGNGTERLAGSGL